MAFDNFGITTKGFEMLAAATTGSLIQMVGGRCSQNTIAQANIPSATDAQFLSAPDGTVKAMSVTDTAAQIIIEFSNAGLQQAITIKSFCLRAMSQGSATAYPFAVCSLNNGGITLQPQSVTGVVVRFQVPFDLTFTGASAYIEGIPVGNNASVDMLDRFVSTHSVGDSAAGDAQTIQGEKKFSDEATFYSGCSIYGDVRISQGNLVVVGAVKPISLTTGGLATFNGMAVFNSGVKLPVTDLDTSVTIPIGAIVCLTGLPTNLGVGWVVSGAYTLGTLNGGIDPQGHQTSSSQEYTLLTATTANITYALAMRRS
jgi:hypothetical protein